MGVKRQDRKHTKREAARVAARAGIAYAVLGSKCKRFFISHEPPPETQFSLVNDTFKEAFGCIKGKRFFISHAPPPET